MTRRHDGSGSVAGRVRVCHRVIESSWHRGCLVVGVLWPRRQCSHSLPAPSASTTTTPAPRPPRSSPSIGSSSNPRRGRAIPRGPVDDTNLGKYLFEVIDRASNRVVYSRGFASIFGEWEMTGEARTATRTFHESLRFPMPSTPVQVVVKKRDGTERVSRSVVHDRRSGRRLHRPRGAGDAWPRRRAAEERRPGHEGRSPRFSVTAIPPPSGRSSRRTRAGWWRSCSRSSRSSRARPTSTSGASARRRPSPASRVHRQAATDARRWARPTTRSVPSATC